MWSREDLFPFSFAMHKTPQKQIVKLPTLSYSVPPFSLPCCSPPCSSMPLSAPSSADNSQPLPTSCLLLAAYRQPLPGKRTRRISEITAERVPDNITSVGLQQPRGESISKGEEDRLEFLGGTGFSKSRVNFEDINNLQSFTVVVNGSVIDSQLSEQERSKYYELSHSQKDCLHDNLSGSNCMLAAGLILQTIIIADAIRAAKLSTSEKQFAEWDKDLLSLELLGMKVGFLRARIKILSNLVLKSEEVMDSNMFRKAIAQRDDVKEKVNTLKDKLTELQETRKQLDTEIGSLEMNIDHYEQKFQEVAGAPW